MGMIDIQSLAYEERVVDGIQIKPEPRNLRGID